MGRFGEEEKNIGAIRVISAKIKSFNVLCIQDFFSSKRWSISSFQNINFMKGKPGSVGISYVRLLLAPPLSSPPYCQLSQRSGDKSQLCRRPFTAWSLSAKETSQNSSQHGHNHQEHILYFLP